MENILLTINIILALILVILVLFQQSEGGALGIGVSQENYMFSRSSGNFFTKATAIINKKEKTIKLDLSNLMLNRPLLIRTVFLRNC